MDTLSVLSQRAVKTNYSSYRDDPASQNRENVTPPEISDKYSVVRELGHGTQGHVYEAIRLSDNRHVAIKQLQIDSVQTWKSYDLFMREAGTLKSLNLPGIAEFYEALEFLDIEHPSAFIVQEFIEGKSLKDMMASGYRFTVRRVFELSVRMLKLLKALHAHTPQIIHRDIKPANVMFRAKNGSDDFALYLIDFGAVANPQVQSGGSTVAGTFGYMSPEQLMGKPVPASDIYALGAMIAFMLSGVEPGEMQVANFRLVIEPHLESIPNAVVEVLKQMLAPNASERLCDHDLLIDKFSAFALNQYQFDDEDSKSHLSSEEQKARLLAVDEFAKPDNIELWDDLADKTPRSIPEPYLNLNQAVLNNEISFNSVLKDLKKPITKYEFKFSLFFTLGWNATVFILWVIVISNWNAINGIVFAGCILSVFFIVGIGLVWSTIKCFPGIVDKKYKERSDAFLKNRNVFRPNREKNKAHYQKLLSYGRKSIATVVDVQYESASLDMIEPYEFTDTHDVGSNNGEKVYSSRMNGQVGYYCHQPAKWRVRYKFNPPDDASPFDLIHEITSCSRCDVTLKRGDVLPILYYINPDDPEDVISTPFPLPYQDLNDYSSIIGHNPKHSLDTSNWG